MLLQNVIIPLEVDENIMVVVTSRPDNPDLLPEIGKYVSYDIQFYVGIGHDICDAVKEFYDMSETEVDDDEDIHEEHLIMGEFHLLEDEKDVYEDEIIGLSLENEDKFE